MADRDEFERDDGVLAAEFVLGLLDDATSAECRRRRRTESGFAALVEGWELHFARFAEALVPRQPPRGAKREIDARLFGEGAGSGRRGLAGALWPIGTLGFGALSLALAGVLFLEQRPEPPAPSLAERAAEPEAYTAALGPAEDGFAIAARVVPERGEVVLAPFSAETGEDGTELWLIPAGEAPISLGIVDGTAGVVVALGEEYETALRSGSLAVSREPQGGSPTGAPTGPILAIGQITQL